VIVSDNDVLMAQAAMRLARKLSGRSGAVSTFQLQDALAAAGHEIDEETAREVLTGGRQFEAFGDDWFRATDIPSERDRLRNVVRKMLSVVSPQSLLSIREGLRRAYRGRAGSAEYPMMPIVPPLTVISAILAAHPEFEVWGEEVHSVVPLDSARELGDTERVFVEVLRSSPAGVLDRRSLAEGCISRGVNENTFSVYTTYSSILDHVDLDVWKLRGVKVDPASVEAVRQFNRARPRQKRVLGHGWTPDGKLWLAARVPRLEREHLVIGCPAAILRFLAGQTFSCQAKGSPQPCGSISVNEQGTSHGYGVFIRRMGIDENDIFLAEFDVAAKTVVLSVGDEELLDEEA